VEADLRAAKKAKPGSIPYVIHRYDTNPGYFRFSWLPKNSVQKETLTVNSKG
jgi:hypothetical protein